MGGLWKGKGIKLATKVKLVKALVFPIVLYGAETWSMRKAERKKIDAFEMWCWRRVMRVWWMETKTNVWVLENIKPEWTLESMVAQTALRYIGHVTIWLNNVNTIQVPSISMGLDARNRDKWRSIVAVVARDRTRLDGTG